MFVLLMHYELALYFFMVLYTCLILGLKFELKWKGTQQHV